MRQTAREPSIYKIYSFDGFVNLITIFVSTKPVGYLCSTEQFFGMAWQAYTDHTLITFNINEKTTSLDKVWRRDWKNYFLIVTLLL